MIEKNIHKKHDTIREFYENVYYASIAKSVPVSRHLHRLATNLHIEPGQQVLDIACGTGNWLMAVTRRGGKPVGIDISQKAIDICKHNISDGDFLVGKAESLPFRDDRFDLISCLGSLEHFRDPLSALQEMVRVAKENARFLLLVPNSDFLTARLGLYSGTNQMNAIEKTMPLDAWANLFATAGLSIKKRWRDLHVISWSWINLGRWYMVPMRALQALILLFWPLRWQYQVYHLCRRKPQ
jgi:ubiquinone/menaquinone biosynthesis C-methylase UbiE